MGSKMLTRWQVSNDNHSTESNRSLKGTVGKASFVPSKSGLESQLYHFVAKEPWVGYLITVIFSFFICKLRIANTNLMGLLWR